jgi:hypothetical protein
MTVVPHPCEATKFIWEKLFPVGNHAAERARTRDRWPPLRERSPPELRSVPRLFVTYLEEKRREWGGRDQFKWGTRRAPAAYIKLA